MALSDDVRIALDGKWRHVREQSRKELAGFDLAYDHDLTLDEARARVLEQMKKLVPTGIPAAGFRVESGGTGDPGMAVTGIEMLAQFDLSLMVKAGRAVGTVRRRDREPRHREAPQEVHPRPHQPRHPRLLRHDRDRSRQRRPEPRDHRDVRPGDPGVRDQLADAVVAQGLHRRSRRARPGRPPRSPSSSPRARTTASTASSCRCATSRATTCPASRRPTTSTRAGSDGGRQRPHRVRPRARPAREPAQQVRPGRRGRHLLLLDREHQRTGSSRCSAR